MTEVQLETETRKSKSDIVDLSSCDREPIHILGYIQPHGVLFAIEESTLTIVQASANTQEWLGQAPEAYLEQPLSLLLNETYIQAILQCLSGNFEHTNPLRVKLTGARGPIFGFAIVHRIEGLIILEIELGYDAATLEETTYFDFYRQVKAPLSVLQNATDLDDLCVRLVETIRHLTAFDRVMIYRFDASGAGEVIAETCRSDLVPYLGLHYPASDIPQQARQLYTLNRLRLIPDATYTPVALVPSLNSVTQAPLDLTWSILRSVSSLHTEYLANMGVRASMSISLVQGNQLWGLISCHHCEPKLLSYFQRTVCEFIGQTASFEIADKIERQGQAYKLTLNTLKASFFASISQETSTINALTQSPVNLLNLVAATGAVIFFEDEIVTLGKTPNRDRLAPLLDWLIPQLQTEKIVQSSCLVQTYPAAESFSNIASGLLALEISVAHHFYLLWFRPEVVETVTWGGNPQKPVVVEANGEIRLSPRKSFAAWQETVRQTAHPWQPCEIEAALELRSAIIHVVLRHAAELSQLNLELKRSNIDLDSFAYIASHDLKEPLRGIYNYSHFLMEDYGTQLDDAGVAKLQTLTRLACRMQDLIDSLLHYSRLGRSELVLHPIDLNLLVQETLELFSITVGDALEATIHPLPMVLGDRIQLGELLTNLVSNALKYTEQPIKKVEIGYIDPELAKNSHLEHPPGNSPDLYHIIYVRDNGIGIAPQHYEDVFHIFKRLHVRDKYGGGTGAGLTIAQKIVERHGGRIWIESAEGQGSTFYFTIPAA